MPKNTDLMIAVREAIGANPRQHDQITWSTDANANPVTDCGTSCCIAGWTAALEGFTVDQIKTDKGESVMAWARNVLGLTEIEACDLFLEFDNEKALQMLDTLIEKGKNGE